MTCRRGGACHLQRDGDDGTGVGVRGSKIRTSRRIRSPPRKTTPDQEGETRSTWLLPRRRKRRTGRDLGLTAGQEPLLDGGGAMARRRRLARAKVSTNARRSLLSMSNVAMTRRRPSGVRRSRQTLRSAESLRRVTRLASSARLTSSVTAVCPRLRRSVSSFTVDSLRLVPPAWI